MKITVSDFIDAIERNGLPKTQEAFFKNASGIPVLSTEVDEIKSACAVGQSCINLGVNPSTLMNVLSEYAVCEEMLEEIFDLNDNTDLSIPGIAKEIRSRFSHILDYELTLP